MINQRPALSENFTQARRPTDVPIRYIIVHATELNYRDTVTRFQAPNHVSAHVVIRQADGLRTQMVAPTNIAWHAGNWDVNCRSLGVEQEAYVAQPASFTPALLDALAQQIREWAIQYQIPLTRAHLLGHDNVPAPTLAAAAQMHQDPGWYFDWVSLFHTLGVSQPNEPIQVGAALQVTANFVDLHAQPSWQSPLLGQQGQPILAHRLSFGQEFVCEALDGDWVAVTFAGQTAWFNNRVQLAAGIKRELHTVPAGGSSLVGSTQPDAETLAHLSEGQKYVISDRLNGLVTQERNGHFSAHSTDEQFIQVWYNHRIGYIRVK